MKYVEFAIGIATYFAVTHFVFEPRPPESYEGSMHVAGAFAIYWLITFFLSPAGGSK